MEDLFAPPSKEELEGGGDLFAPPSKAELGENETSAVEAGIMQGLQGVAAGFGDEIAGGLEAGGRAVGLKGLGGSFSDIGIDDDGPTRDWEVLRDAYRGARDKRRELLKKQSEEHPVVSGAANIAGAVASPLNKITKGISLAKGGMALGGINALGNSEAEDLGGMARDTATGAALGAVLGKVADKASPIVARGVDKTGRALEKGARRFAARALGAERGTIKSLGADEVEKIGQYALDNDILSPLASTDDKIARNLAVQSRGGQMMDDVYGAIDDAGVSSFSPLRAAQAVDDKVGDFYRSPINRGETAQLENTLDSILMRGADDASAIPIREAQRLKQEIGKTANWKNNINVTDKERMARESYGVVSGQIDDAVESGARELGDPAMLERLQRGKSLYGSSMGAEKLLQNRQAAESGNKILGLTDWELLGGSGLGIPAAILTGGTSVLPTVGALAAKKGLEKYGSQNAALGLNKVAKAMLKSPQMLNLYQKNPAAFQALAQKFESQMASPALPRAAEDQSFNETHDKGAVVSKLQGTKYQQVMQNAANNGDQSFSAAHFVLSQRDPDYRKALGEDDEE